MFLFNCIRFIRGTDCALGTGDGTSKTEDGECGLVFWRSLLIPAIP
jgi:hypothetical protein